MVEEKLHNNLGEDLFYSVKHPFEPDIKPIYHDIVVGPKYRPFSDISLCICCIYDWTFPENIVIVLFMT